MAHIHIGSHSATASTYPVSLEALLPLIPWDKINHIQITLNINTTFSPSLSVTMLCHGLSAITDSPSDWQRSMLSMAHNR